MINASMTFIKYPTYFSELKKHYFSPLGFEKYSNIKLHDISASEISVVAIRKTDMKEQLILRNQLILRLVF
jgi:hypothetical protein